MNEKIRKLKIFIFPSVDNDYRPLVLNGRFFSYLAIFLIFAKFITLFYLVYIPKTYFFSDIATAVLIKMTNEERTTVGALPLRSNAKLNEAALMKANDMIKNNYFSHWSPDGKSPWHWFSLAGYDYDYAGENLAIGFFDATEVHRAWINSYDHRENIMNPAYEEVGIAVVKKEISGRSTFLVVQMFGSPREEKIIFVDQGHLSTLEPAPAPAPAPKDVLPPEEVENKDHSIREDITESAEGEKDEEKDEEKEKAILGEYDTGVYIQSAGIVEKTSSSLAQFLLLKYDDIIRKITVLSLLFLGFILLANVFVRLDVQHPDLIFKGLIFLAILLVFEYFDQEMIVKTFLGVPILG